MAIMAHDKKHSYTSEGLVADSRLGANALYGLVRMVPRSGRDNYIPHSQVVMKEELRYIWDFGIPCPHPSELCSCGPH